MVWVSCSTSIWKEKVVIYSFCVTLECTMMHMNRSSDTSTSEHAFPLTEIGIKVILIYLSESSLKVHHSCVQLSFVDLFYLTWKPQSTGFLVLFNLFYTGAPQSNLEKNWVYIQSYRRKLNNFTEIFLFIIKAHFPSDVKSLLLISPWMIYLYNLFM